MPLIVRKDEIAENDLVEIVLLIAREQPEAALRFIDRVEEHCDQLSTHPEMGSPKSFPLGKEHHIRRIPVRGFSNYGIFYKTSENEVRIIRVLHGSTIQS